MSLRTRLIVSFFALSVVPLAAVTFYTYRTNVEALRVAAEREADLLAGELSQRMQLVTAQLSERVEHMMNIAELQAAVESAASQPEQTQTAATPAPSSTLSDQIANSLGEAAMLLNNVELQGLRGGGRGGGRPPPPPGAPPSAGSNPQAGRGDQFPAGGRGASRFGAPNRVGPPRSRSGSPAPPDPAVTATPAGTPPLPGARVEPRPPTAPPPPPPGQPGSPPAVVGPAPSAAGAEQTNKLTIDITPIRREMFRQMMGEERPENLTPEMRQRLADEINQRMMGIVQGIQLGAAELQRKADEAQRLAEARSKAAQTSAKTAQAGSKPAPQTSKAVQTAHLQRKSSLSGSRLDVKMERDGQVVREANAEINLPNVLATVFSTTRRDGGEVPFAVGKDGHIYTRTDEDRTRVAALGAVARPAGPQNARLDDWIVVTTQDPSGSGLRLGIARPVGDSLASLRRTAARNASFGLLFIAVALIGIVPISSRLTRNLTTLSEGVRRIAQGDYRARVPVRARDEVGELAAAFNQMAEDVEKHQRSAVEQERIKRELELGRQIQNEMLPHEPLKLGLTEIKGVSVPAREVGGDFFNYFQLSDGQVALLMGDVSGKGVGAALLMANIQASLRTRLALGQDLSAIAEEIDHDIEENSPGPVYATLFIAMLDLPTRVLRYVNAGHHPQYVLRKTGGLERMSSTGLPVGLLAGRGYREERTQLSAGDLLFFYTDGCVDAENESGEMFDAERLEGLLVSHVVDGTNSLLQQIESTVRAFRGTREPFDDAAMMAVKIG